MPISLGLRTFRGRQPKQARARAPFRPTVHRLESRLVMSAGAVRAAVAGPTVGLSYVEGSTSMINLVTHLPANAAVDSLSMSWGDGCAPTTAQAPFVPSTFAGVSSISPTYPVFVDGVVYSEFQGRHVYLEEGNYQVQLTIKEHDFTTGKALADVTLKGSIQVQDARLSPSPVTRPALTAPSRTFTGQVAFFQSMSSSVQTDPLTDFTATIDWGDKTSTSQGTVIAHIPIIFGFLDTYSVNGTHTYKTAGDYQVTVQVKDKGGSTVQLSNEISVSDVANITMSSATVNPSGGLTLNYTVNGPVTSPVKVTFFGSEVWVFDAAAQKVGQVSLTSADLTLGSHQLTVSVTHPNAAAFLYVGVSASQGIPSAIYAGASGWFPVGPISLTMEQVVTTGLNGVTVTVTSSAPFTAKVSVIWNPSTPGSGQGRFAVTVSALPPATGTPTGGTVVFWDGAVLLGAAFVTNGKATFTPALPLSSGMHHITALYLFDPNFQSDPHILNVSVS